MLKEAFIVDGQRTAFGKFRGTLSSIRTDDLLAHVIKNLVERQPGIPQEAYDDVIMGCANQAGEDNRNVARMALLLAGLPWTVPGETLNRLCSSGMSTIVHANRAIKAGDADLVISGGVEHMTRGPLVMSKSARPYGGDSQLYDSSFGWRFVNPKMEKLYGIDPMGNTAENLVDMYNISREDQDKFALWSQQKASAAQKAGRLAKEICSISIPRRKQEDLVFNQDEFIRHDTSMEALGKLRTAFRPDGTVTAGNASGLNDGAAAVIVASEDAVKQYNLNPIARIVSSAVVGVEPRIMGIGPVFATRKALTKAKLSLDSMGVIELNEAFAAQALACTRQLGLADNDSRVNPNGGAIAIGHPLGVSGTRITHSLALEMQEKNLQYGLATMCVGVGQGYAIVLEKV
ncbi:MAG: acetyl-CoA C-acyltransferase [Bacteroidota bacterium]